MKGTLDEIFSERTKDINYIFESYRELYQIYITALKALNANKNTIKAIENTRSSVDDRQLKISDQLYAQGFILLTGAAEALLKDIFQCLLIENFTLINSPKHLTFSVKELQEVLVGNDSSESLSTSLGKKTVEKLYSETNPIEKINLQNVQTMKQVLLENFDIEITDSDYIDNIHRYWQVRHCLIHNVGIIDKRFLNNVGKVKKQLTGEKIGQKISVNKSTYDQANEDFTVFFSELNQLVEASGLNCSLIKVD